MNRSFIMIYTYFSLINALAFIIMGIDKRKAVKHKRRISERMLISCGILGGAVGVLLGMVIWKHKLYKPKFTISMPLLILCDWIIFYFVTIS